MEKQVYTRITEKLRQNKELTPLHKLLIGFLNTYQSNPDGSSTKKFYYDTQETLAEELGVSTRTIKTAIQFLEDKSIIFQPQKSEIDGRPQYKNRKAIILVDKNNPLPSTKKQALEPKIISKPIPEVQKEEIVSEIEDNQPNTIEELKELINDNDFVMKSDITFKVINIFKGFSSYEVDGFIKDIYSNYRKIKSGEFNLNEYINNKLTQKELV